MFGLSHNFDPFLPRKRYIWIDVYRGGKTSYWAWERTWKTLFLCVCTLGMNYYLYFRLLALNVFRFVFEFYYLKLYPMELMFMV